MPPIKKTINQLDLLDVRIEKRKLIIQRKAITKKIAKLNNVIATRVYEQHHGKN